MAAFLRSALLPRSCGGWVLAAFLLMLVFAAAAYSARDTLQRTYLGLQPGAQDVGPAAYAAGERPRLTKTANGARVTLTSIYAEEDYVVVGYEVEDLTSGRRVGEHPAELQPLIGSKNPTPREAEYRKEHGLGDDVVELTDESGADFRMVNNSGQVSEGPDNMARGPMHNMAAFEPDKSLAPGEKHRFQLKVPLIESPVVAPEQKMPPFEPFQSETFVFDLEVPVRAVRVVEVGEKATAEGITLTLDRVIDSPGKPEAVVCYEAPGDEHSWFLWGGSGTEFGGWGSSGSMRGVKTTGCQKLLLKSPPRGRSSLEVATMEGMPVCRSGDPKAAEECHNRIGERLIQGPWTFEFDAPVR